MEKRVTGISLALLMGMALPSARADVGEIDFGPGLQAISFIGDNTSVKVQLGNCSGGTCSLNGPLAAGDGTLDSGPAPWSITTSDTDDIELTGGVNGLWGVSSTTPILFSYGFGSMLLAGNVHLVSLQQTPNSVAATFSDTSNTISATGGILAPAVGSSGGFGLTAFFTGPTNLSSLLGAANVGKSVNGYFEFGDVTDPPAAPEPTTLLLMGSGLILAGMFARRANRARLGN